MVTGPADADNVGRVIGIRFMPCDRREVGRTRRWLRDRLAEEIPIMSDGIAGMVDDLETCLSELLTNALLHITHRPGDVVTVVLTLWTGHIRVEVSDGDRECEKVPHIPDPDFVATSGRGLAMVDFYAAKWGWHPTAGGKIVWCEMEYSPPDP